MAWDFQTDPEYQEQLDWVDTFVREEVDPLDMLFPEAAAAMEHAARSVRTSLGLPV